MATSTSKPRRTPAASPQVDAPSAAVDQAPQHSSPVDAPPKAAAKKAPAKQAAAKKAPAKKAAAKKAAAKKTATKKPAAEAADTRLAAAEPLAVDLVDTVLAVLSAPTEPPPEPPPAPTGPAHSRIALVDGPVRQLAWLPGHACPPVLVHAAAGRLDAQGHLQPDDDEALPLLLRLAQDHHHTLQVDEAVWPFVAANRDARTRLALLAALHGPDVAAGLPGLLSVPLAPFQAEGALFAVVAGRALLADERGLGKSVQALAAVQLWRRHFGVQRVLVLCAPAQRLAWQRAWQRFVADGSRPQVMEGGLHQRQALWSTDAAVRVLSPEALASDAAHLQHWAPDLIIVDEPQGLGLAADDWAALQSPHALVLCGAALADEPALMQAIVQWLDVQRQGPLAALLELQSASDTGRELSAADIDRLTAALSRLMLQRQQADVADQLPPLVHTERLVPLTADQRDVHDRHLAVVQRGVAGWAASGYLSDTDQWRLAQALRDAQLACHRAEPGNPHSTLAEASVQAIETQLAEWAATGGVPAAVLCTSDADRHQLQQRPALQAAVEQGRLQIIGPDDTLPGGLGAVIQVGVPWRTRRNPAGPRGQVAPGQQWVYLVAAGSIECGLFDTLALRTDAPRSLAEASGARDYLHGQRLSDWLQAVQAMLGALQPVPAALQSVAA